MELNKVYQPEEVEERWYQYWLENNYFHAKVDKAKKPFSIVIPPPNVTGMLHIGHALNNVLQDVVVRKRRMQGYDTLWLPGTDHAGIATQNVVEQQLKAEGTTRQELGREEFIERVWEWKEKYGSTIINQLKKLGCSCDWDRERFTMDEGCSKAVRKVFVQLYEENLIYRDHYIINWCPRCHTALSDIEVEHEDISGKLWYVKYRIDESDEYIIVATTRPETILGDTAVAVNPADERFKHLVGLTAILPVLERPIPIIADDYVDPEFGTGVVKITPAHDPNDFEVGKRHSLPEINVMTPEAKMNAEAGPYEGLDRYECREAILKDLEAAGLLVKADEHEHAVGHCYRCNTIVEPYLSLQWFVRMKPLAAPAIEAVKNEQTVFIPQRWTKLYFDWMDNIRDWCISRQLWWGHRIPVWHCDDCGETIVAEETPVKCGHCHGSELRQETDVLDTWFSSALWPFSTMGWPDKTDELDFFYPTSLLSTAFDIIYFWVARMMMMGLHFMDDVPFKTVYIHALIRDAEGRKMSKSTGNVIDPLVMIEKFGTDAVRFTLASMAVPGRDVYLSEERIQGYRNFANKIWNAARFVFMNLNEYEVKDISKDGLELIDRWIFSRLENTVSAVEKNLEALNFSEAARALYDFVWNEFCDWYIEAAKPRLNSDLSRSTAQYVLVTVLENSLRLLHPFMPFITEEIWQQLPSTGESIMVSPWPKADGSRLDADAELKMSLLMTVISSARKMRSELNVAPSKEVRLSIRPENDSDVTFLEDYSALIMLMAKANDLQIGVEIKRPKKSIMEVDQGVEVFLPFGDLIDIEAEIARLQKASNELAQNIASTQKAIDSPDFINKAPAQVVEKRRALLEEQLLMRGKIEQQIQQLLQD